MRESEALGRLDHPAILHVYDAGQVGDLAYRIGNWVEGEALGDAVERGPRPIPMVLTLARDLLGALEHAHLNGIIVRAIVPALGAGERGRPRDRHRPALLQLLPPRDPAGHRPTRAALHGARDPRGRRRRPRRRHLHRRRAPLLRRHRPGARRSTRAQLAPPTELRPTCPRVIERIVLRALQPVARPRATSPPPRCWRTSPRTPAPTRSRRPTVGDAAVAPNEDRARWEKRLRRALGDDYELLEPARHGRIRPGLPGARPPPRAPGGAQGAAPVADARSRSGRALPPRSAARRQARPPEHREHLRHRRAVGSDLVHHGADRRPQPGAAGGARRAAAARQAAPPAAGGTLRPGPRARVRAWCTATSSRRTC